MFNYFFMLDFESKSMWFVISLLLVAVVCHTCVMQNAKTTLEMRRKKYEFGFFLTSFIF